MLDLLSFTAVYVIPFFLVILTVVITIHELGHYWAARMFGVAMDRFSIGFGRAIFSRADKRGMEWRIGWIPLGGYVKFSGDTNAASVPDVDDLAALRKHVIEQEGAAALGRYYHFKPVWQRAVIAAAGPLANFALAFAIFTFFLVMFPHDITPPVVGGVAPDSPAAAAGIRAGDEITHANGRRLETYRELSRFNFQRAGDTIRYTIRREDQSFDVTAALVRVTDKDPITGFDMKRGLLGVTADPAAEKWERTSAFKAPIEAAGMVVETIESPLLYIGRIFQGRENGDQLSGVLGIATTTGKVAEKSIEAQQGAGGALFTVMNLVNLTAALSVAIGFVNLLPIPVLDGGHLMFYAYEAVARRPVGARIQEASYKVGLALVLALMLFAGWNDLQRMQAFEFFGGLFS